jgi:hypothetical protein
MDRLDYGNSAVACIAGQWVPERDQNNFGSGPRESGQFRGRREAYHTIHRIFHPPGSAGSSFKTERFEMAKPYQGKNRNDTKPLAKHWARHAITLLLFLALIVVGIVAYCARQQWWELYMSLTY